MEARGKIGSSDAGTRRLILDFVKRDGPQQAGALARRLGVSAMAVRQHLYALQAEGLVAHDTGPRADTDPTVGRPAKLWHLTSAAEALFPDGHAGLALDLIGAVRAAFGARGMDRLLATRSQAQVAAYAAATARAGTLRGRLAALAKARTAEGYMAEVVVQADASYLLVENHCPVCAAARACTGLCAAELAVFRAVLGPEVSVERTDHILAGARRCAYRVTPLQRG
jgi:predicted ArsR family transcriptional regulator